MIVLIDYIGPAYTAVTARTTLRPPGELQQQRPKTQARWPDSLKKFVGRCFQDIEDSDPEKPAIEQELKRLITQAFEEDRVWEEDWDNKELEILTKRKQQLDKNTKEKKRKSNSIQPLYVDNAVEVQRREKRARRFDEDRKPTDHLPPIYEVACTDVIDWDKDTIVGRCQTLEKRYLRLTSAPDPETVRPLPILKKTLDLLKKKWRKESNYAYICDQFKSLRQDLTVQRIKNEFTVTVYELHARVALEKGDLGEYNQCQTQLVSLYEHGLKGNQFEFLAYRILYLLHTRNHADVNDILSKLTPVEKSDPAILHALEVRSALATSNYHRFFSLYLNAPNMGGYLMDCFIVRERVNALCTMCKAYRPYLTVRFIADELGFENEAECIQFLQEREAGTFLDSDYKAISTKDALEGVERAKLSQLKIDIKGQI
ncbi:THP3 protein [Neolecta irregularis DAH-3]|uniref:THP3 protein n=1 Tax=Neolecta irregularis (strain DAH-3) TaxID=1198029 RepID=A0A1U7LV57_NEOID|nr:THP3 protein [Neolecta irregularis DAH-3]|eukprot:OLL26432.1 THP3 protein [Neolecta irregularis DAH-3]